MELLAYMLAGVCLGGLAAWFFVRAYLRERYAVQIEALKSAHAEQVADLEKKAGSGEARVEELRQQLLSREAELGRSQEQLDSARQEKVAALTRLEAAQKSFDEQKALIEAMKQEMTDTFNALSAAALKSSSEDFLRLASEHLSNVVTDTKGRLGEHQAAMDGMIKPLHEMLKRYEIQIKEIEETRHKAYGSLEEQMRALASTHDSLQKETSNLVTALRKPHVRGRWGEMQLKRVAELSGMSMHCDFTEQQSVETEKGRIRPDMIVHLPMDRQIVVDSKVSLDAYLDGVAAQTEEERKAKMIKHAQQVRTHMNKLSSKEYWSQFRESPEFVVLFIPGESFLSAALDADSAIIEEGIQKRVIIATPTTFVALLRAIAYGWRQEQVTKNAQTISELGRQMYDRMSTLAQHFDNVGAHLEKAIGAYNKTVASLEARVLPSVRRFKELGVSGTHDIPTIERRDQVPRNVNLLDTDSVNDYRRM